MSGYDFLVGEPKFTNFWLQLSTCIVPIPEIFVIKI